MRNEKWNWETETKSVRESLLCCLARDCSQFRIRRLQCVRRERASRSMRFYVPYNFHSQWHRINNRVSYGNKWLGQTTLRDGRWWRQRDLAVGGISLSSCLTQWLFSRSLISHLLCWLWPNSSLIDCMIVIASAVKHLAITSRKSSRKKTLFISFLQFFNIKSPPLPHHLSI